MFKGFEEEGACQVRVSERKKKGSACGGNWHELRLEKQVGPRQ